MMYHNYDHIYIAIWNRQGLHVAKTLNGTMDTMKISIRPWFKSDVFFFNNAYGANSACSFCHVVFLMHYQSVLNSDLTI